MPTIGTVNNSKFARLFRNVIIAVLFCIMCGLMVSIISDSSDASTITFDTDGGSNIEPITGEPGTPITAPENPTKAGFIFDGWDETFPDVMPENDKVFKAQWATLIEIEKDGLSIEYNSIKNKLNELMLCYSYGWDSTLNVFVMSDTVEYKGTSYKVTAIDHYAFKGKKYLTSITIPEGVTSIGNGAFSGSESLVSVTLPNSVTSIGSSAFSGCKSLRSITLPDSISSIEDSTFQGCSSLDSFTIPDSVTSVGKSAFDGCKGLKELTLPINLNAVGDNEHPAFKDCTNIEKITFTKGSGRDTIMGPIRMQTTTGALHGI